MGGQNYRLISTSILLNPYVQFKIHNLHQMYIISISVFYLKIHAIENS